MTPRRHVLAVVAVAMLGMSSCGRSSEPPMSDAAARGLQIANRVGCASCHGDARDGASVGPSWVGAWGTTIPLEDGRDVTFDERYVIRSVRTPDVDRRVGDWLRMPAFDLDQVSDAELADLVEYVRTLGER